MITGNNEIVLNQASMLKAIQLWLDHQFKSGCAPRALHVEEISNGTFKIRVEGVAMIVPDDELK